MAENISPPNSLASGVGALPHRDPPAACDAVLAAFPRFPYAPTLPGRGLLEGIVFSESAQLPGRILREGRLYVDTRLDHSAAMEQVYQDFVEGDYRNYPATPEYNSGFHAMLERDLKDAQILKCQATGAVTFGMQVTDCAKRPLFYDSLWADMLGKLIALRARWYEAAMRERTSVPETLVVLNEPYLAALGSSVVPIDADAVAAVFQDAASLLKGGLGVHCCSNTDWGFLISLRPALISFDAYTTAREFLLYADEIAGFLEGGGAIAWGIVPAEYQVFRQETEASLYERFQAIRQQVCEYVDDELFFSQSLITPTCGIRFADEEGAEAIMQMTAGLSRRVRGESA
ncbi:MAG: hypothetical protein QMD46_04495 [Methanomicrobiales archaeon]|nr:hypothetical protein [Methanomicrobiales archaeon]MDI6876571.1 hypothetical protein [Methanomicrobiales archaeon]